MNSQSKYSMNQIYSFKTAICNILYAIKFLISTLSGKVCDPPMNSEMTTINPVIRGVATLYTKNTSKKNVDNVSKHPQISTSTTFLKANLTTLYTTISHKKKMEADDTIFRQASNSQSTGTSLHTRTLHSTTMESSAATSLPSVSMTSKLLLLTVHRFR